MAQTTCANFIIRLCPYLAISDLPYEKHGNSASVPTKVTVPMND